METEVMSQIALRLPSRLLNKVDFVTRRMKEHAKKNNLPMSFANRSTIIRQALDGGGLGELVASLNLPNPTRITGTRSTPKKTPVKRPRKKAK